MLVCFVLLSTAQRCWPVAFGVGYYTHHHSRGDTDATWALPVNVAQGHVIIEYLTLPANAESARIL